MLPPPVEDAINTSARAAQGERDVQGRISVIGEKQLKNPLLFPPPSTKGLDKPRRISVGSGVEADGSRVDNTVEILGNSVTSGYTSDTLAVIAVINEMWTEQGRSGEGKVTGTYVEVARRLGRTDKNNESRHRNHVKKELERLRRCILIFGQFFTSDQTKHNHEVSYFCDLKYVVDRKNQANNFFQAKIDPTILGNLLTGYISSLPKQALLAMQNDAAKPVLLRVDSVLAVHPQCELSCDTVYSLASIPSTDWTIKPSVRKKTLQAICDDIHGKVLSSGWEVLAELKNVARGGDLKLAFTRGQRVHTPESAGGPQLAVMNTDSFLIQELVNDISTIVGQGEENARLYASFSRHYPEELVRRALSEFRADKPDKLDNPGAFFTTILRRIVTAQGYGWLVRS